MRRFLGLVVRRPSVSLVFFGVVAVCATLSISRGRVSVARHIYELGSYAIHLGNGLVLSDRLEDSKALNARVSGLKESVEGLPAEDKPAMRSNIGRMEIAIQGYYQQEVLPLIDTQIRGNQSLIARADFEHAGRLIGPVEETQRLVSLKRDSTTNLTQTIVSKDDFNSFVVNSLRSIKDGRIDEVPMSDNLRSKLPSRIQLPELSSELVPVVLEDGDILVKSGATKLFKVRNSNGLLSLSGLGKLE